MDATEKQIVEMFAAFQREQDPGLVYRALDAVEDAQRDAQPGDSLSRKRTLSVSLTFLAALDQNIDPKWNPDQETFRPVPPQIPGVVVFGDGQIDPTAISDLSLRARYEKDLAASRNSLIHYNAQFQLHLIDQRATAGVQRFVERCYGKSRSDRSQIAESLSASTLSAARKSFLGKRLRGARG